MRILTPLLAIAWLAHPAVADDLERAVADALGRAGQNRANLTRALAKIEPAHAASLRFLIAHMPTRDLTALNADFLLEHVRLAHRARAQAPWSAAIPEDVFLNGILPYANVDERRDRWRADFSRRLRPLVVSAKTPGEAATILNRTIFKQLGVRYSTKRQKPNQSPYETIESGLASCTGLSILLIDACRAVGVPARFVGTPRWADNSGNHSWVEVWDGGDWHFTGAAEPTGDALDRAWFMDRASHAKRDEPRHAIYAVSYRSTPLHFPLVWSRRNDSVSAVNVTDRYTQRAKPVPDGHVRVRFRVVDAIGERSAAVVEVRDGERAVFEGTSKDERFDANDHLTAVLRIGHPYTVHATLGARCASETFTPTDDEAVITLTPEPVVEPSLTREQAAEATKSLRDEHAGKLRETRAAEMKARVIRHGDHAMRFHYTVFGERPPNGRSLFISMHGGGGAPKRVNDRQWDNQKKLYRPPEGVYVAPRAPTDTWNLWHQAHIDPLFDRLIENLIVFEGVDPDRVYLMGYSAGGDGVFQLAPRMADRFAAAAMMAGHPNETSPVGLRNLPFTLHMGGRDKAYKRNEVAREWKRKLAKLHEDDPGGYEHWVKIYPKKAHWMDREDAAAVPWMMRHTRNPFPKKIVWRQDDVRHPRFYWLAVDEKRCKDRAMVRASLEGQTIRIDSIDVARLTVRLNDRMLDLDRPVTIVRNGGEPLDVGVLPRTRATLAKTLSERGDPNSMFSAEVTVVLDAR